MKKRTKLLSLFLTLLMMLSIIIIGIPSVSSWGYSSFMDYVFTSDEPGLAQGYVYFLMPPDDSARTGATYNLYWADEEKALEGYGSLGTITESGSGSFTMPAHTVIPPDARYLIAANGDDLSVDNAHAAYKIPEHKLLSFTSEDVLYTFGAISDAQIANDSYGSGSYPNDETHLKAAFETLYARGVDFTVSSGDTVNDQNGKQTYAKEYRVYQQILADSSYSKPIYEAIGNHDVGTVWNKNGDYYNDNTPFIMATGLDSTADTINKGKPYFEVTEPTTGDHFIFMALEGGFYTNKGTQFSTAQLDWLEGLLKAYQGDGRNIFIIEHANIAGWGSGDKLTAPYYYDLALEKSNPDVQRFINLMEEYKECIIITGHTHLELSAHYNYSDNNGTSAIMIHNSAIGGVRRLVNGTVDRTPVLGLSEGYIVEVYEDCIIFNGTNMYENEIMPQCSYIIPIGEKDTDVQYKFGDADQNGTVNVKDATAIQKHAASIITLEGIALAQADVTADGVVNVKDATSIQKFVAGIISKFPAESQETTNPSEDDTTPTDTEPSSSDNTTLPTDIDPDGVTATLSDYYIYSSYNQYMELKSQYKYGTEAENLHELQTGLITFVEAIGGSKAPQELGEINIYFTNNKGWSSVYAYVWGSDGTAVNWPGTKMTKSGTNSMGEDIYKITVDLSKYQNIIFTNNSGEQTEDIVIVEADNTGYYISGGSSNKYTCGTYAYS